VFGHPKTIEALLVGGMLLVLSPPSLAAQQPGGDASKPGAAGEADDSAPGAEPTDPSGEKKGAGSTQAESGEPAAPEDDTAADAATTTDDTADDDEELTREGQEVAAKAAARAAREQAVPRPPLPPEVVLSEAPKWKRRLEIGGDFAIILRPFANGLAPSEITYLPAPAWGVHLHWAIFSWLRLHPYFLDAHHSIDIPAGALRADGSPSAPPISDQATLSEVVAETFVFGAKLAPTLNVTDRLRGWISVGVGWGRFAFSSITVTENTVPTDSGGTYEVRERAGVFVEFPFGLGMSFDVIPRWLAVEYEFSAAPVVGQSGTAHETFQAVDEAGTIRNVGAFGAIEASFVNALGLSLIL